MSGIGLNCKSSSMNSSQVGHLIPYRLCLLSCQCYLHPVQPSDYWACGRCLAKLLDLWLSLAWRSFSFLLAGLQDITYHAITSNRCRPAPRAFHDTTTKKAPQKWQTHTLCQVWYSVTCTATKYSLQNWHISSRWWIGPSCSSSHQTNSGWTYHHISCHTPSIARMFRLIGTRLMQTG